MCLEKPVSSEVSSVSLQQCSQTLHTPLAPNMLASCKQGPTRKIPPLVSCFVPI